MAEDTKQTQEQPTEQESEQQSLLGDANQAEQVKDTPESAAKDSDRPTWLPEKFKSAEDFAKSYSELEGKMADQPKVPKEYDYSFAKDMNLDMDKDQETQASEVFKHYGLSQDQAKGMLSLYSDSIKAFAEQYDSGTITPDLPMEQGNLKNTWGNAYDNNMGAVRNFAKTLGKGTLEAPLAHTAEGLQVMYDAMQYRNGPNPIGDAQATNTTAVSIREKINELRDGDNYKLPQGDIVGDNVRAEIYRLYQQLERTPKQ